MKYSIRVGDVFGRLTVIGPEDPVAPASKTKWVCRCVCGTVKPVNYNNLVRGTVKSCGCLREEMRPHLNETHGLSGTGAYKSWKEMRRRCLDKNKDAYARYGGRGIKIFPEWEQSFEAFYRDMGPRPEGKTLGRLNNDGDYWPGNVEWQDDCQQANNKRNSHTIAINGEIKTISEWARIHGLTREIIKNRISRGWSPELAATTPRKT